MKTTAFGVIQSIEIAQTIHQLILSFSVELTLSSDNFLGKNIV